MAADKFEVVITAIVVKGGKYLILRRSATKKRFPGRWTVPGGHLEVKDFVGTSKESDEYWYNVLEKALRRKVTEEAGISIKDITYVTSLATVHEHKTPSLVISCMARHVSGKVVLQEEECDDYAWVTIEEAKKYDLIDGIFDELWMAHDMRHGILQGAHREWTRA
jgi:8-oxo-dGTP diphosphatase